MLQMVKCEHLLNTFKIYEGENNIYCVGQYYSGGTLYEYIKNHGKPTVSHSVSILRQLLVALNYLESKDLIHRDIKPENIMFKDKTLQKVALVDFGFMTRADEYNKLFTRCGTPGYVAPEVLQDIPYDTKADVYSLGILFYILLTKINPFMNKSYSKLIKNNKSGNVDFQLLETLTTENKSSSSLSFNLVVEVAQSMLQKDPALRPKASEILSHELFQLEAKMELSEDGNFDLTTNASPVTKTLALQSIDVKGTLRK
jgi:serine/threonine protein kinase